MFFQLVTWPSDKLLCEKLLIICQMRDLFFDSAVLDFFSLIHFVLNSKIKLMGPIWELQGNPQKQLDLAEKWLFSTEFENVDSYPHYYLIMFPKNINDQKWGWQKKRFVQVPSNPQRCSFFHMKYFSLFAQTPFLVHIKFWSHMSMVIFSNDL